jgi:hypothetical protein
LCVAPDWVTSRGDATVETFELSAANPFGLPAQAAVGFFAATLLGFVLHGLGMLGDVAVFGELCRIAFANSADSGGIGGWKGLPQKGVV